MWRSCPAGTRGASLLLAPVSVPMRRGGEGEARRYTSPVVSFVYIVHLVSVRETARALSLCFVLFFALILPSGCVGMERWHALFSASEKIFCIRGWLGNSLGDITPCLCRLIVCHGKAIHPYTTSFLPRLPEINFPFCLFPIETDPKHVCLATHTDTSPSLPRHAGAAGGGRGRLPKMGIKSPCFPRPWILLCPSGKAPLPRRQRVTQGFFCPAAHSGAGGRTSACQVRRPPAAGTAHLDGAGSSGLCRQQTPQFHRGGREEFDRKYTWAARAAQPGDSRLGRR